jgi:methionyl-tRNA synthetase
MLLAHNDADASSSYKLPENVPANEFMNLQSQKLSKSRGWTVEVHDLIDRYPADVIRYAFATMLPEAKDSDFLWKEFQAHVNNELADIFGNFANRVLTFVSRNFENAVPQAKSLDANGEALLAHFGERAKAIADLYQRFRLREATAETVDLARSANKYFNDAEPWKLIKQDRDAAAKVMLSCLEAVRALAAYFDPITPNASAKIRATLGTSEESWFDAHNRKLTPGTPLGKIEILFQKIEDESVMKEIESLEAMAHAANAQSTNSAAKPKDDGLITIDDFKKIKLRTAKVLEAERVPKSKKLIRLQIAVGTEQRQIVAGIGEKYAPESLVGKSIVVVANLQPAKLMGNESNGMLLAVNDENGVVALVGPEAESASGLEVR